MIRRLGSLLSRAGRVAWPRRVSACAEVHAPREAPLPSPEEALEAFRSDLRTLRSAVADDATLRYSLDHWENDKRQQAYLGVYAQGLRDRIADYGSSIGLDFGCWTGFSSLLMRHLGARRVVGVDVSAVSVEAARHWTRRLDDRTLDFLQVVNGDAFELPLPDGYFDWVVLGQVYCNMNPHVIEPALDEIARVLRPGGTLYLNDSNNPRCETVSRRLLEDYQRFELGAGTTAAPDGEIYHERKDIIAEAYPDLAEEEVASLAAETCYLWYPEIINAVRRYVTAGKRPGSRFEPEALRAVVRARLGNAATNPTDPVAIAEALRGRGLDCAIAANPGGADLHGTQLEAMLTAQSAFHLYARKPLEAQPGCRDLDFSPYRVVGNTERSVDEILAERHDRLHVVYGPDFAVGPAASKVPSADFSEFVDLLEGIADLENVQVCTVRDVVNENYAAGRVPLCLKHDIDSDLEAALWMAEAEAERGMRATFYVLHTAPYYGAFRDGVFHRYENFATLYVRLQELGHEVGLHFNPFQVYEDHGIDGGEALREELRWLRSLGLDIDGAFGHSSAGVLGVESIEFFLEHLGTAPEMVSRQSAAKQGVFDFKGRPVPRLVASGRELGLDYFGEFLLRGLEYSYWSVLSQERCRPAPSPRLVLPSHDTTVAEMLRYIAEEQNAPFQMLNIHPETYGLRASPRRDLETETRNRPARRSAHPEFGYDAYAPREPHCASRPGTWSASVSTVHYANALGMLDYEPPPPGTPGAALVLCGGERLDGLGVAVPAQLQSWLRDRRKWNGEGAMPILKMAGPGGGPREYSAWTRAALSHVPEARALFVIGQEFVTASGGVAAAAEALGAFEGLAPAGVDILVDDWGGAGSSCALAAPESAALLQALGAAGFDVERRCRRLSALLPACGTPLVDTWAPPDHEAVARGLSSISWPLDECGA